MTATQWKIAIGGMAMGWGGMLANAESPFGISMAIASVVGAIVFLVGWRQQNALKKKQDKV